MILLETNLGGLHASAFAFGHVLHIVGCVTVWHGKCSLFGDNGFIEIAGLWNICYARQFDIR